MHHFVLASHQQKLLVVLFGERVHTRLLFPQKAIWYLGINYLFLKVVLYFTAIPISNESFLTQEDRDPELIYERG